MEKRSIKLQIWEWIYELTFAFIIAAFLISTIVLIVFTSLSLNLIPINSLMPWVIGEFIAMIVFSISKDIIKKVSPVKDTLINQNQYQVTLKLATLSCFFATLIPALWYAIYSWYVFTIEDAIIGILLSFVILGAGIIAFIAVWKRKSTIYLFLYFLLHALVLSIFTVLSQVWIVVVVIALMGVKAAKKITSSERHFLPNFTKRNVFISTTPEASQASAKKTRKQANPTFVGFFLFALIVLSIPITTIFAIMPSYKHLYQLDTSHAAEAMEINFTWANATELTPEALSNLTAADQLSRIEISITAPLINALSGDYGEKANISWDIPIMVTNSFKEIENTPIDEVDELDYVIDGYAAQIVRNFSANGIEVDFMPLCPKDEYYMYINDLTIEAFYKYWEITKIFIERNNLTLNHRGIVVDTERDYNGGFQIFLNNWWNPEIHTEGSSKLTSLVQDIRLTECRWKSGNPYYTIENYSAKYEELKNQRKTHVSCATFQYHLDDFVDADDEQQHFYEISIFPPNDWDLIGVMLYDKGANSDHNTFGYCRATDYLFGKSGVPYLYSEDSYENILRKFRIAQNYGYNYTGMWALASEVCFADWNETGSWCGGFADRFGWQAVYNLCAELNVPETITFEFDGEHWFDYTYMHALQLLDLYLIGQPKYTSWPLNGVERIRFPN